MEKVKDKKQLAEEKHPNNNAIVGCKVQKIVKFLGASHKPKEQNLKSLERKGKGGARNSRPKSVNHRKSEGPSRNRKQKDKRITNSIMFGPNRASTMGDLDINNIKQLLSIMQRTIKERGV